MSRPLRVLTLVAAAIAAAACTTDAPITPDDASLSAGHAAAHSKAGSTPANLNQQLAALRSATARFHDIEVARKADYTILFDPDGEGPGSACLTHPTDGAMGEHYVNLDLLFDGGAVDVTRPEALIYEPMSNGKYRLVAVEYVVPFSDRPSDGPAPELLGQKFMPNHNPGFQLWALHAWVWENNPSGMFEPWNPKVSCKYSRN
jgi:hypothetical protein